MIITQGSPSTPTDATGLIVPSARIVPESGCTGTNKRHGEDGGDYEGKLGIGKRRGNGGEWISSIKLMRSGLYGMRLDGIR